MGNKERPSRGDGVASSRALDDSKVSQVNSISKGIPYIHITNHDN